MTEQRARLFVKTKGGETTGYPTNVDVKLDGTWLTLKECDPGPALQIVRLESCEAVELVRESPPGRGQGG